MTSQAREYLSNRVLRSAHLKNNLLTSKVMTSQLLMSQLKQIARWVSDDVIKYRVLIAFPLTDRAERDSVDDAIDAVVKHGGNLTEATSAGDMTSSHKHEIEAAEAMTLLAAGCLNTSSSPIEADRPSSPDLECHEKIDSTPTKSDEVSLVSGPHMWDMWSLSCGL